MGCASVDLLFSVACARDVGCWFLFVLCFFLRGCLSLVCWLALLCPGLWEALSFVLLFASLVLCGLCRGCELFFLVLFLVSDVVYQVVLVSG